MILDSVIQGIEAYGWRIFSGAMILLVLEWLLPASRNSMISRMRAAVFWLVYIIITATVFAYFNRAMAWLGVRPLLIVDLSRWTSAGTVPVRIVSWTAAFIAAGFLGDFFYYWFHRLQHANPYLWRFHKIHHSLREMSGWNSNHHFTEEIFRIPFVFLPLLAIVNINPGVAPTVVIPTIFGIQGLFVHSCTRLNLGRFRRVVADNRYHRIHHSMETNHRNKNFGSFSSVWDVLFRTAYFPGPHEWPETGVPDIDEPKNLAEFLWRPFASRVAGDASWSTASASSSERVA